MQSTTYEPRITLPGSLLGFFGLFISCILVLIIYLSDGLYYFIWTSCFFSKLLAQVMLGLGSGLAFILFKHKFLLFLELLMNNLMDMDLSSSPPDLLCLFPLFPRSLLCFGFFSSLLGFSLCLFHSLLTSGLVLHHYPMPPSLQIPP